jgi:monoamine oxidase
MSYYDIIIIGSGISGLYSAYNIKKNYPTTTFLILEKYKKQWIGGRTSNGKGYKSLTKYRNGKKIGTSKKSIYKGHVQLIKTGKFIPGFFSDCCKKSRRNK